MEEAVELMRLMGVLERVRSAPRDSYLIVPDGAVREWVGRVAACAPEPLSGTAFATESGAWVRVVGAGAEPPEGGEFDVYWVGFERARAPDHVGARRWAARASPQPLS